MTSGEQETTATQRIHSGVLKVIGYCVPLVQSIPAWTGLMTLPFASYLILIFTNLPVNLPRALIDFFMPYQILEKTCVIIGFFILISSAIYLLTRRTQGLITSGPYRWVRHPQYLGMMMLTLGLTSWSVWILNNTFGVGFLSASQTIGVWLLELFVYILLAYVEEQHLSRNYHESFKLYKSQVPFFIPLVNSNNQTLDFLFSILIPASLLLGLVTIGHVSPI